MKSDRSWMTYLMYHEPMTKKHDNPSYSDNQPNHN